MRVPRTEWTSSAHPLFAEVAEVFGIETDLVMAAMEWRGQINALVTLDREEASAPESVQGAVLMRDPDGVLVLVDGPNEMPDLAKALRELIEETKQE